MPVFSWFCMDGGRGNWRGLILGRLLPGKAGTALGRGQASAVYDLIASVACPIACHTL